MFTNKGVLNNIEYLKVYTVFKYYKKIFQDQKKATIKKLNKHQKGELQVVKAIKQKPKKGCTLTKSAQERLNNILETCCNKRKVAGLTNLKRCAALKLEENADLVKKIKLRKKT